MTELDYGALGFKCGIEIHQQLDTRKLFCACPSVVREDEPHLRVGRRMRAVAGEMGGVDPAALYEFLRNRRLVYEAYEDTTCLVELDEEPPAPLNKEALEVALTVALLLGCRPVHEAWVMRKTVIDGSNTAGFQRTALIATGGALETSGGVVGIPTVCLEEDAARLMKEEDGTVTYRLDRLGIPLVEIATSPDIKNPAHARDVAEKIGSILRATGKVKRGLGTIRQDLNVSIAGGERIEIKGVQDLKLIKKIVETEVARQLMLVEVKRELERRRAFSEKLREEPADVSTVFSKTASKVVKSALEKGGCVLALRLPKMNGLLKDKLGPELAQYARAYSTAKGLFHTDELPGYGITQEEVDGVSKKIGLLEGDAFAIVCEEKTEAKKALDGVLGRLACFWGGVAVPKETRKSTGDGGTDFMRPLPGADRMYPETDEMPVLTGEYAARVSKNLPKLLDEVAREYEGIGLSGELASQLAKSNRREFFDRMAAENQGLSPTLIANTILSTPKEAQKRHGADAKAITDRHLADALKLLSEGVLSREVLPEALAEAAKNPKKDLETIVSEKKLGRLPDDEVKKIVDRIVKQHPREPANKILGLAMAESKGKADPKKIMGLLEAKK